MKTAFSLLRSSKTTNLGIAITEDLKAESAETVQKQNVVSEQWREGDLTPSPSEKVIWV